MNSIAGIDSTFEAVTDLIRARTGLVFPPTRRADVETGTRKIMAKAGIVDLGKCLGRIEADPLLLDDLIAELTIGETYFFREPGHFAFIRDEIVPELRRLRGAEHVLRVWSAGCASGEEPYSLAILFEEMGLAGRVRILATDISRAALARAREAAYGVWSLRGNGARLIGQYLRRSGGRFELAERFPRRVEFAYLNLAQDAYPTFATNTWGMDLVLCRNVLIYLDAETARTAARRLHDSLAPGGFLITGPSDPLLGEHAPFETLTTPAGVIYRRPLSPTRQRMAFPVAPSASPPPATAESRTPIVALGGSVSTSPPAIEWHAPTAPTDPLAEAREALARGDSARVVELTRPLFMDVSAAALCVRALANLGDTETSAAMAADVAARHPASLEVGFLHAVLLMNLERYAEAERALKRVLYLDRSLAVAHFALGAALHRLGNLASAARAYRNARDIAARHPPEETLTLSDGERAGRFAEAAASRVEALKSLAERGQ